MGPTAAIGADIEIFAHSHVGKDTAALWHVDQAASNDRRRALALDRHVLKPNAAAPGAGDARDGEIERRFSGAVRAEHGHDLAGVHAEIDATQNFGRAVAD